MSSTSRNGNAGPGIVTATGCGALRSAVAAAVALAGALGPAARAQVAPPPGADPDMVLVAAGPFVRGSGDGQPDEAPPARLWLPAFWIDRTEVTREAYAAFVAATGTIPPPEWGGATPPAGTERWPVTNVTWAEAMRYALWAGKRLPTEAEWEKAARGTDGRRFPWGNAGDPARRDLDTEKLGPVGRFPAGASPWGCLDVAGNAWEWTADWYDAYPGADARSVHFGEKYKVIRGGGAIYFYGAANTGRTTERGRLVPYGRYDSLGFRCARDAAPGDAPYDAAALLAAAAARLAAVAGAPAPGTAPAAETLAGVTQVPLRIAGAGDRPGWVRLGLPLPRGLVTDPAALGLVRGPGERSALQAQPLLRWADGSLRWVLLDFVAAPGEELPVDPRAGASDLPAPAVLRLAEEPDRVTVETGAVTLLLTCGGLIEEVRAGGGGAVVWRGLELGIDCAAGDGVTALRALPAAHLAVEERGPVHAVIRWRGQMGDVAGAASDFHYDLSLHVTAGLGEVRAIVTFTRRAPRDGADALVRGVHARLGRGAPGDEMIFGLAEAARRLESAAPVELVQADELSYQLAAGDAVLAEGARAPGWAAVPAAGGWATAGARHFWQNHPAGLRVDRDAVTVRLWAGAEPLAWEGGLAKTHEIVLGFDAAPPGDCRLEPLRATLPPAWACATGAAGTLLPRAAIALERMPYWEGLMEWSMARWVRAMPSGWRDFGDAYYGGPYKGKNAYANLEYDVPLNFLVQYLRTGQAWYAEAADAQARHQADIDINHATGQQWKHSPLHTTTEADLGHVFLRGLLLHHLTRGDRRSLEAAREIGDWLAPKVARLEGIGNERQIGWSLFALTGLYEVTGDARYLDAALAAARRLAGLQEATGRFAIRWDNRIAFFNGIAMNGLIGVYEQAGDEAVARAIEQLGARTLGFYPEYACRTLNAFAWLAARTGDARYRDGLARAWESSLEFLRGRETTSASTHALDALPLIAQTEISGASLARQGEARLDADSWRLLRLNGERVELFVAARGGGVGAVRVIAEGLDDAELALFDAAGRAVAAPAIPDPAGGALFREADLAIPAEAGPYRLLLRGAAGSWWQIHSDAATRLTLCDPAGAHLGNLYPRAYGFLREGAEEIALRLHVEGEGFHGATLYDPAGHPVAAARRFVDLGDPGRYEIELRAPAAGREGVWGLDVCEARVAAVAGLLPYWATAPDALFHPERP